MNKLKFTLIEKTEQQGYWVLNFVVSAADTSIYSNGNFGVNVDNADKYEVGKTYDLNLDEVN